MLSRPPPRLHFSFQRVSFSLLLPAALTFDRIIAHGLPAEDKIAFLRAAGRLTRGAIMDMDMRRAARPGVILRDMPFQALVQIPRLGDVDGNPTAVGGLA